MLNSDYIAFGAHGPREPLTKPGHGLKVLIGTIGIMAASGALFYVIRQNGKCYTSFFQQKLLLSGSFATCHTSYREAKDHQSRMGRGNQRIHEGAEDEPHLWYCLRRLSRQGLCCFKIDRIFLVKKRNIKTSTRGNALLRCAIKVL